MQNRGTNETNETNDGNDRAEKHLNKAIGLIVQDALAMAAEVLIEKLMNLNKADIAMEDLFDMIEYEFGVSAEGDFDGPEN